MQMHKKYLEVESPILSDGDFMGFFLDSNPGVLDEIILEGLRREELVFISPSLSPCIDLALSSHTSVLEKSDLRYVLDFLHNLKLEMLGGKSGIRLILDSVYLFSSVDGAGVDSTEAKFLVDDMLKLLMRGKVGVACMYESSSEVLLSHLCLHPRLFVDGKARSNPFFVLPGNIKEEKSDLSFILDNKFSSAQKKNILESQTFPMGLNDSDMSSMLESIIDSMGAGVVVGDRYGNMVLFNKAVSEMMGLPASPLPYAERIMRFGNYLPDKLTPYPFQELPLSRAIRGEDFDNELVFVKNSKKPNGVWLQATGRGVRDSHGNLIGGVLVSRDVTEEKSLQEENDRLQKNLIQNQKLDSLEVLAGGIAHDFNNLLVGVLGNASIILQQIESDSMFRSRIEQVQEAGLQLSDLTKQLLIYAGINPSRGYKKINLNELVSSMAGLVEAAVSKKMTLQILISEGGLPVEVDEVQVRQILLNLAMNAADAYGEKGGKLGVFTESKMIDDKILSSAFYSAAEVQGVYAGFEVRDEAGGIEESILTKIFDPFFSTKGMGRGLGLSAVLGIIKAHRGFLELNTILGKGTSFKVWFPMSSNLMQADAVLGKKEKPKKCKKVLVIDDEDLVLEVSSAILSHHGIEVVTASSGRQGLSILKESFNDVSLVILDMNMPDMHGEVVYCKIREKYKNMPVIISSGFSKELSGIIDKEGDRCFYLEKPYSASALLDKISSVLSGAELKI